MRRAICLGLLLPLLAFANTEETLQSLLAQSDPDEVVREASRFLSATPVPESSTFTLDESGLLKSGDARLVLLDRLGRRGGEFNSARFAEWTMAIARSARTPAERIVALRNAAWIGRRDFVAGELRQMLGERFGSFPECVQSEILDGAVYLADPSLVVPVVNLIGRKSSEVAAAQALDRMAAAGPLAVMRVLNDNPGLLSDRPMFRADLFAKANLSDPPQRQEFERQLLRAEVPVEARVKAMEGLLQRGQILTVGLFTGPARIERSSGRSRMVRSVLVSWKAQPRFAALRPAIESILESTSEETE